MKHANMTSLEIYMLDGGGANRDLSFLALEAKKKDEHVCSHIYRQTGKHPTPCQHVHKH